MLLLGTKRASRKTGQAPLVRLVLLSLAKGRKLSRFAAREIGPRRTEAPDLFGEEKDMAQQCCATATLVQYLQGYPCARNAGEQRELH